MDTPTTKIAALNDALRTRGIGGQVLLTVGVRGRGPAFVAAAIEAVRAFSAFTADNDPYGEHDFGAVEIAGTRVFWKIDYFDGLRPAYGAEDPSDPSRTMRVLTVMLAEEY
jgi:hypothetical protein